VKYTERMDKGPGAAILTDAGLASLIACAAAAERGRIGAPALVLFAGTSGDDVRREAASRQAEMLGLPFASLIVPGSTRSRAEAETLALLAAGHEAARRGVSELIWPVQPGGAGPGDWPELDDLATCVDRALLVSRLVALDSESHQRPDFRISTPHVDLTDRQLADLAADLGVNPRACWWWDGGSELAVAEAARWTDLLRSYGLAPA
jgi:hypothetical protein